MICLSMSAVPALNNYGRDDVIMIAGNVAGHGLGQELGMVGIVTDDIDGIGHCCWAPSKPKALLICTSAILTNVSCSTAAQVAPGRPN